MTKRVLISLLLLLLAVSISAGSFFVLQKKLSALGEALQDAVYADLPIDQTCAAIEKNWKSSTGAFHIFLPHSDVSQLQTDMQCLSALIDQPEIYRMTCIRSLARVQSIAEDIVLTADNIL